MEGQWFQSCTWLEFSFDGKPNKISPKQTPLLQNGAHVLPRFENNCASSCITVWNGFFLLKTFSINHAIMFLTLNDRCVAFSSSCVYWFVLKRINLRKASTDTATPGHCMPALYLQLMQEENMCTRASSDHK